MSLLFAILMLAGCIWVAGYYWEQFGQEDGQPPIRRWLKTWIIKGAIAPVVLWLILNTGLFFGLPPLMPAVEAAKAGGGGWVFVLFAVMASGVALIASCWTAVTFAWLVAAISARVSVENRREFLSGAGLLSIFLVPLAAAILYLGGWLSIGLAGTVWLLPIARYTLPLAGIKPLEPVYSRAIAKIKFNKYEDAEWEILRELEKCENDFEGWLLLAELYAVHFHDLAVADQTIYDLCDQSNLTGSQISVALHRLADWHLNLGEDPVAARRALEIICERVPGTHLERMARQRLDQIPATREAWRELRKPKRIRLPALGDQLEAAAGPDASEVSRAEAVRRANQWVEKLKQNPNDAAAREELARLFAERLEKADLAIEQVELLLGMPGQPAPKMAEWLALQAAWHLKYRRDGEAARGLLQRLVREYPQTPQAFSAQRRLNLMEMERKMRQARAAAGVGTLRKA